MTLSQIAALLGLDETTAIRPVPLTDEEIARRTASPPPPQPNRAERRATRKREGRHLRNSVGQ